MSTYLSRFALALSGLLAVTHADAAFHLMKVVEVYAGGSQQPGVQYVVLQMYSNGQNQVSGHGITVSNAAGNPIQVFSFGSAVASGASQDRILVATAEAQTYFSVSADLVMLPVMPEEGGRVCFDAIPQDCVAWGNYSGSSSGVGTPFNAMSGLVPGEAAVRRLDLAGGASVLDAADDTDDSANDFVGGTPAPRNNAGVVGVASTTIFASGFEDVTLRARRQAR